MPIIGSVISPVSVITNGGAPIGPNGTPSNAAAVMVDETTIHLTWTNGATNADGTYIYRSLDDITYVLVNTVPLSSAGIFDTPLASGTLYYYKLVHYKGALVSPYSNTTSATTEPAGDAVPTYAEILEATPKVLGMDFNKNISGMRFEDLTVTPNTSFPVSILMNGNHADITFFKSLNSYSDYTVDYTKTAGNVASFAAFGPVDNFIFGPNGSPTNLIATTYSDSQIDITWTNGATNQDGTRIYVGVAPGSQTLRDTLVGSGNSFSITGLNPNQTYYIKVAHYVDTVISAYSNIDDATTTLPFIMTIDTTKAGSANDTFVLPTRLGFGYDFYVDWGDGGAEEYSNNPGSGLTHVYPSSGVYDVKIRGIFPSCYFNNAGDKLKLIDIKSWGTVAFEYPGSNYWGCSNLIGTYTNTPNFTGALNTTLMFFNCTSFNGSVANWDLKSITSIYGMFRNCSSLNKDFSSWNVSAVTDFFGTFNGCSSLKQSFASWNISAITSGTNMFANTDINNIGTTTNYDNTLISWAAQNPGNSISIDFGTAKYSNAAVAARGHLTNTHLWTITDGGQ